jgi:hypothetical protein
MPQPYLPTFQHKPYAVGANHINHRPKLAAAITHCISMWSYVDNELGGLFGILFGTESPASHRVFLIIRRLTGQREALDAAAEAVLKGDELTLYRAVIKGYGSFEPQRNTLSHGCFGICPDDEDLLFVINVEHHVLWQADVLPKLAQGAILKPHQGLLEKMCVYRLADLVRLHQQMEQQWWDMFHFNNYLRNRGRPTSDAEFAELFAQPHIQERIDAPK